MKRIAILDTGVGASEDDFVKLHVKKSFDFTTPKFSESNIGLDDNGHGTTCAKIILKNAAKSEIYSLKVLDKNRCGKMLDLYVALQYLLTQEVDIINMSLAFSENCFTEKIRTICEELSKQGKMIIASVGRYEKRPFPASFHSVLGVQGKEFENEKEFLYEPSAEIQITADDTPVIAEWRKNEIFILGGTSKATALMSGRIAKWETNISQRLKTESGIYAKKQYRNTNNNDFERKYTYDQAVLKEIIKLLPCGTEHEMDLYHKKLKDIPFELGIQEYVRIINSLIRKYRLQLPEYVPLGNIFNSIFTLEEFVRRYRTCQTKSVSKK